jgi:uncharacterized protein involved in exopolysaccharide biosynthesis
MGGLVRYLTINSINKYESETTLYTGMASGSSVDVDKSINYNESNTAFDNLVSVIKSRETQQEVAIRLLARHLILSESDLATSLTPSFRSFYQTIPGYVKSMVVKEPKTVVKAVGEKADTVVAIPADSTKKFSFSNLDKSDTDYKYTLPLNITAADYELTVMKLTELYKSNDTNYVYKLINSKISNYSLDALSGINANRVNNSDLLNIKYQSDDPGISQVTLQILTEVCIRNFKKFKENRSDAVVKYFEFKLDEATSKLSKGEENLLDFNKKNNLVNFNEQSKSIAIEKEQLESEYNNKKASLAGHNAVIKRLEEKMGNQQIVQTISEKILDRRNQLGIINYKIAAAESTGSGSTSDSKTLSDLKQQAEKLKEEIKQSVSELSSSSNSVNGVPISAVLTDWISNVIEAENLKAGMDVLSSRIKDFRNRYESLVPAGSNIKRIEREISVAEQEYLENLHGLNQAKLKMQDNELASTIKPVDFPFFPANPVPNKRKLLIIAAAVFGFLVVLSYIVVMEYFDNTLKNKSNALKILNIPFMALFPKILLKSKKVDLEFICNRMMGMTLQSLKFNLNSQSNTKKTKSILVFSTLKQEGKSVIASNLVNKFRSESKKVLHIEISHKATKDYNIAGLAENGVVKNPGRFSFINWLLGYPDNRIDVNHPFLNEPVINLTGEDYFHFEPDELYYSARNYQEILEQHNCQISFVPDYVIVELPPVLLFPYPTGMFNNADLSILICRSNRAWSPADKDALAEFQILTDNKIFFILNGVELPAVEMVMGVLPKKQSGKG